MAEVLFGICGPTASGKTELSLRICEKLGGEVISADSMQVYTGMDILSAMPDKNEIARARHHLIGFVAPNTKYNASRYRDDAVRAIREVRSRGVLPLLCGGTGLYIDALTKGIRMSEQADEALRERLKQIALEEGGKEKLYGMLLSCDPASAKKYDRNDVRRVIRSLEIFYQTGKPRGEQEALDSQAEVPFDAHLYALRWNREALYRRIDRRVDDMVKRGLIDEVKSLLSAADEVQEPASQAIAFKEIKLALQGEISMEEAITLTKTHSRHLAKRQETWFRRDPRVTWFDTDGGNLDEIRDKIIDSIMENQHEF